MKKDSWAYIVGYIIGIAVVGFLFATFVTFVIGLFQTFPLTLINIFKVWAVIIVYNILTTNFRK